MERSRRQHDAAQPRAVGMDRFFSPANLARYRTLAGGAIDESERFRLLRVLGEEMKAFRREARAAARASTIGREPRTLPETRDLAQRARCRLEQAEEIDKSVRELT